jgi:hypothetical protein
MKPARLLACLLIVAVLAGCSAMRVAYNNADTAVRWMADNYFDFEGVQADDFKARLSGFHAWHRNQELPKYSALLVSAGDKLADGLTQEELVWAWDNINERLRVMAEHAAPEMAVVLTTLTPAQFAHMERKFAESNADYAKEHIKGGEAEQRKRRMKRNLEWMQDWFGDVSEAQEARLQVLSDGLPLIYSLRLQDRKRRQKEFAALLKQYRTTAELTPKLRHWLSHWEEGRSPEYQRLSALHQEQYMQMLLEMDKVVTPVQRAYAVKRMQKYAEVFNALTEEGKAANRGS